MVELVSRLWLCGPPTPHTHTHRLHSSAGSFSVTWYQVLHYGQGLLVWYIPATLRQLDSGNQRDRWVEAGSSSTSTQEKLKGWVMGGWVHASRRRGPEDRATVPVMYSRTPLRTKKPK